MEPDLCCGIAEALAQVFTYPPATDPTLYLMPDATFNDYGATRQGENSQYFSALPFQINQYGSSAAVVRTIKATVGKSRLQE